METSKESKLAIRRINKQIIDDPIYENWKEVIIESIKEAWDSSKFGNYYNSTKPDWLIDISSEDSHPLNETAKKAANIIMTKLTK